jgi:glycosyltransferase involved in cell wall biosynthesis
MNSARDPAVWFPTVRTGTGTDVFTERLARGLAKHGIRSEITWLPLRAEYAPWTVPVPGPPEWANVAHVNTWLHPRFLPKHLPIVATIHHSVHHPDFRAYKGFVRAAYHQWWIAPNERRVLRRADRITAVSQFVAETARNTLVDLPMHVIHNGVDIDMFRPGNRQRKPGDPFRLLYVGSWIARKGVDMLAPIMRELSEGFELYYTGGVAAKRDKPSMPSNMYDIGRLQGDDVMVAAMQNHDALLFPSRSEGFGLAAAEAMACGLPVVATHGSSLVEIVEDGVTGVLCSQGDIDAFAAAVRSLARDFGMWRRMADAARTCVVGQFAADAMIGTYIRIYHESISR